MRRHPQLFTLRNYRKFVLALVALACLGLGVAQAQAQVHNLSWVTYHPGTSRVAKSAPDSYTLLVVHGAPPAQDMAQLFEAVS